MRFNVITRNNVSPQGKSRVYFTCHPDNVKYLDHIKEDIWKSQDCAIYYTEDMTSDIGEMREIDLNQMNLFVIPVTWKLLSTQNRAMNEDFIFAYEHNIPVLPIMEEKGLYEVFSVKFKSMQYLSTYTSEDKTEIPYEEKLKKFLESVLVSDETAKRIRAAFDAYIFLSYRKKDRKYANELMQMIHRNPLCRDIAIWYDEFLSPGENFRDAIAEAMKKSDLFTMMVTPNLLEEGNYVQKVEYPKALEENKDILPVEMEQTDEQEFRKMYDKIDHTIKWEEKIKIDERLVEVFSRFAKEENDIDPKHNFLIGLAYLEGIDMEVNREKAVELITGAANANLPEAMKKLADMYHDGYGVDRDWNKWLEWMERRYEKIKEQDINRYETFQMAFVYQSMGKNNKALTLYKDVKDIWIHILGSDHSSVLTTKNNIAGVYDIMGKYDEALSIYKEVNEARERTLGEEHPDTLTTKNNIASVYHSMGRYEDAISLYNKVKKVQECTLGEEHPSTLITQNNIAGIYSIMGKYDKALNLYEKVKESRERILGAEHTETLNAKSNIASVYHSMDRNEEALRLFDEVKKSQERVLGEEHPSTLITKNNMAVEYKALRRYKEALLMYEEVKKADIQLLGKEHPLTLTTENNMAVLYYNMGRNNDALCLFEKVKDARERILGANHLNTLDTKNNLAVLYAHMGMNEEALCLFEEAKKSIEGISGADHPDTLVIKNNMANVYRNMKRYKEALNLYEEVIEIQKRKYGISHPDTLITMTDIGMIYFEIGEYTKSLGLLQIIYEEYKKLFGEDDNNTIMIMKIITSLKNHMDI